MIKTKFPKENLILGDTIMVNNKNSYINLKNENCLIKGDIHYDMPSSMYIDVLDKFMSIRCKHPECFGKTYPCQHILMNKNEMNIAFNGNVTINVNGDPADVGIEEGNLNDFLNLNIFDDKKFAELVFHSFIGNSQQLANLIFHKYSDIYNYGEDGNWYIFDNHRWYKEEIRNSNLRNKINPMLQDIYTKVINFHNDNGEPLKNIKKIRRVYSTFGDTLLKNNIMSDLADLFYDGKNPNKDFVSKLDRNSYLIGFNNGVYDLSNFIFRDGVPEDYVSISTGYDYSDERTDKYNDLLKFLEDIQPEREEREYMLTYLSTALFQNTLELFTIMTGIGRNGKSKLIELLQPTFGDYYGAVPAQLFTRPMPNANEPDPGLLNLLKKKIVVASEAEKFGKLNTAFIKFLTGRDHTTLRECHSNKMIDFTAKFITLFVCNNIPECDEMDIAMGKRLRCINFPTEFVKEPKKANQKLINENINENFDSWKSDLFLLLVDYYKTYIKHKNLKPTNNILRWTNQYKEDTDIALLFLNEMTKDSTKRTHCSKLYESFKIWFMANNPQTKIPNNKEFINNLRKHKVVEKLKINGIPQLGIRNVEIIQDENSDNENSDSDTGMEKSGNEN